MKALVFGASGQLGRALVRSAPNDVEVRALDRKLCDIAADGAVERAIAEASPDIVFNAAAYTAVDRAESEPELAERMNAHAPGSMARAARDAGARFVHVSTDFVFDGSASHPYAPGDKVAPLNVYGRSKVAGEQAVIAATPQALIVRSAWIYAPQGGNFMTTMLRLMRQHDRVSVVADQVGTPTSARSLAEALWALVAANASGIHHFTDSGIASWYDFAVAIAEEAKVAGLLERDVTVCPISTAQYPTPARRPAYSVLDKASTWELLGGPAPHWRANLRVALRELGDGDLTY